ncbi:MAG: MFS transporter [Acidobacteriota bacterium]|nr:MFS transporter [Acidobacteriota bacterium]
MLAEKKRGNRIPGPLWLVLVLLGLSAFISYVDRANLSIAAPILKDELGLSASQLGVLLSSFFWSYVSLQLAAGWLVDRVNVNWFFAGGFFLWSAATLGTGFAHGFFLLLALRMLLGVGESVVYPSYSKIISLHYREEHRGVANSIISAGLALGPGLSILAGGLLIFKFGWRAFFVALGVMSLCWLGPWIKWMPDPATAIHTKKTEAPSFGALLRQRAAWGTCMGMFGYNYLSYFMLTWLPFYLMRERNFSMYSMAKIGGAAYIGGACCALLGGWWSDRLIRSGATATRVRKTFVSGGLAFAGGLLLLSAISAPVWSVVLLMLGIGFQHISSSNIWALTQTLAGPYAAGRWTALQNFAGNFAGVVAPALTGLVLDRTSHFSWAFVIVFIVALVGAGSWLFIVGPVVEVDWPVKRATKPVALEA